VERTARQGNSFRVSCAPPVRELGGWSLMHQKQRGSTFLVDVQADEVDNGAHGCLVPFWFSNGAEFFGAV
jgi:hypothetical protein